MIRSWSFTDSYPCVNSDVCNKVDIIFFYLANINTSENQLEENVNKLKELIDSTENISKTLSSSIVH